MTTTRATQYTKSITTALKQAGHATNADLLAVLRMQYPEVSATTIHRVTTRLYERGQIDLAPPAAGGSLRYDSNTKLHHHFACKTCLRLRDVALPETCITALEAQLGGCKIRGSLTIQGICEQCEDKGEK